MLKKKNNNTFIRANIHFFNCYLFFAAILSEKSIAVCILAEVEKVNHKLLKMTAG